MKAARQSRQQSPDASVRLSDLPDVIGVREYCAVLHISERQFYRLKRHGCLPVRPLKLRGAAIRFSNEAVRRFVCGSR
jgi:predicted DNA-binding transcriptional regulator AlpA